ncbi:MAG: hypothetical protein M3Y67_02440, partial [Pseudomonadota bacterium]|nr:hypothetical protein [Pseudomonadota bacterium]
AKSPKAPAEQGRQHEKPDPILPFSVASCCRRIAMRRDDLIQCGVSELMCTMAFCGSSDADLRLAVELGKQHRTLAFDFGVTANIERALRVRAA